MPTQEYLVEVVESEDVTADPQELLDLFDQCQVGKASEDDHPELSMWGDNFEAASEEEAWKIAQRMGEEGFMTREWEPGFHAEFRSAYRLSVRDGVFFDPLGIKSFVATVSDSGVTLGETTDHGEDDDLGSFRAWTTQTAFCPSCAKVQQISMVQRSDGRVESCSKCGTALRTWTLNPETQSLELDRKVQSEPGEN